MPGYVDKLESEKEMQNRGPDRKDSMGPKESHTQAHRQERAKKSTAIENFHNGQ